ncbi:MAG TPA: cyanophycinase [Gemmatimonadales bacterium]|nr:cyanophycinase [Gemmatimonadales bacterium]
MTGIKPGAGAGYVVPVGGAEDKVGASMILRRFTSIAGGDHAVIAILPTASEVVDTGERYARLFQNFGARKTTVIPITSRTDANDETVVRALDDCTGIFITGGNQLRLGTMVGGTELARTIRARNSAGAHVAGTSAGAAFLCEHMIAFGEEGASPLAGSVTLAPGLGLSNTVIIDQHFRQRDRLGRLLTALAYNPFALGLGLDENTAAFIGPDHVFEVVGGGSITVVDPSGLEFSSMARVRRNDPVCLIGLRLHILDHGSKFNLTTRKATPPPEIAERP